MLVSGRVCLVFLKYQRKLQFLSSSQVGKEDQLLLLLFFFSSKGVFYLALRDFKNSTVFFGEVPG